MPDTCPPDDRLLIERVRAGDRDAEHQLYARFAAPAVRAAIHRGAQRADAEDYVAEAFLRVLRQLRNGAGPHAGFRPYLHASIRNAAADARRGQRGREVPTADLAALAAPRTGRDPQDEVLARLTMRSAMTVLPRRWREVLWRLEVEGHPPAQVAAECGVTAQSISALAYRARRALRHAVTDAS